jgi:uncharacterized protein (DUF1330 family)
MSVDPTPTDLAAFVGADWDGPLAMVNLLKFADQANYGDRDEEPRTGIEAYALYGQLAGPYVVASGATILYRGPVLHKVIGDDSEDWDEVLVVKYPNRQAFIDMISNPEYQAITYHRTAGLARAGLLASRHEESPF